MHVEFFPGFFVPASRDHWVERMVSGAAAFERELGVSLARAHSGTKFHATSHPVADHRAFFKQRLRTRNRWFSLYCGTRLPGDYHMLGGSMYADDSLYRVLPTTPAQPPELREKLLVTLGDALGAHSAQYTPSAALWRQRGVHWAVKIDDRVQRRDPEGGRTAAEAALPVILESTYAGLAPLQPHHFGWINYWSKEVCAAVRFEERAAAAGLLEHSRQTPAGAWLVKLSATPPDTIDDAFARRLAALYAAFPEVGRRL